MDLAKRIERYNSEEKFWCINNIPPEERSVCLLCARMRPLGICINVTDKDDVIAKMLLDSGKEDEGYLKKYGCEGFLEVGGPLIKHRHETRKDNRSSKHTAGAGLPAQEG